MQIREADLEARRLTSLVRSIAGKLRGRTTRLLVNDRLDVAMAAGADGVHLKESSLAPELARRLASAPAQRTGLGASSSCAVTLPVTATARHSADYLIAGTVLPTVSKSAADYLGWKGLEKVIGAAKGTPVLGIGGLDLASIRRSPRRALPGWRPSAPSFHRQGSPGYQSL